MARRKNSLLRRGAMASLLCLISAALLAPTSTQASAGPGASASIIGGDVADIADFPSLAFIVSRTSQNQGFACTGTVIAPRLVLTAAHCVEDLDLGGFSAPRHYRVATGRSVPTEDGSGEILRVAATHVFPGFDPGTTRGDAALLVLASPTPAPALALAGASDNSLYGGGAAVRLAGWGLTSPRAPSGPKNLRSTSGVVQPPALCRQRTQSFEPSYSTAEQMCTTDPPDHANGNCFGDSGGPAIASRADGSPVQIGVVSTGGPECSTKLPTIFTRVDRISTWATEWAAAIEQGTPPPGLRARLPRMSRESAEGLVGGLLNARFGPLFAERRGLRGECRRLGPAKQKCELLWLHGPKLYAAAITVFYALSQNTVAWGNHYVVRRASIRCLEGANSKRCRVETRRG